MKSAHVTYKEILGKAKRMDAPVHLSTGNHARRLIAHSPYPILKVGDASQRIWHAGRWRRVYVSNPNHGITLLGSSAILKENLENEKLVSLKYTEGIEDKKLKAGWILISCSGTIGNCAFSNAQHAEKLASQHVIRIKPNNILRPGLIYAYLASRYGYAMLTQGTFGSVIQHIEPQHVESIPIPRFPESFQKEVDDLIQEAARLREEATSELEEAVSHFNTKYPIKAGTTKYFTKQIKDLSFSIASYNNNVEVRDFVNSYINNCVQLKTITSNIFAPPLFKHIYLTKDNGYPFMTGSELTKFNLRYYRWLSPKGVKDIKDYVIHKGTLLLYKSGTTDGGILGHVFISDKKLDGCCLSDHVIRIVFNHEEDSYWAFAFLKSQGAIRLLQSMATGTMIPFITPERLSDMFIPAPDEKYSMVCTLIRSYIEKVSKAKCNDDQAISLVEKEIGHWNKD